MSAPFIETAGKPSEELADAAELVLAQTVQDFMKDEKHDEVEIDFMGGFRVHPRKPYMDMIDLDQMMDPMSWINSDKSSESVAREWGRAAGLEPGDVEKVWIRADGLFFLRASTGGIVHLPLASSGHQALDGVAAFLEAHPELARQ